MLLQFRFKNFKSFRDENILDMSAMTISNDDRYETIKYRNKDGNLTTKVEGRNYNKPNEYKVLNIAALFGANASGKSKFIEALETMLYYVNNSFNFDENKNINKSKKKCVPFVFDENKDKETLFEITFYEKKDKKIYRYGFTILNDIVKKEWLYEDYINEEKEIFSRENNNITNADLNEEEIILKTIKEKLKPQSLFLSTAKNYNVDICSKVYNWFNDNFMLNYFSINGVKDIDVDLLSVILPKIIKNEKEKKLLIQYVNSFDDAIIDLRFNEISNENYTSHKNSNNEIVELNLEDESAGTIKMLGLFFNFLFVIQKGLVLIIDELNLRLHPLLVWNILLMFHNKEINKNGAQLIFTSHDTWMLKNRSLRRDEIWFTEKKENVSSLYSLDEFMEVTTKDYQKAYLYGDFGAIPNIQSLDFMGESNEE